MNFCSDNVTEVAPEIMAALLAANQGSVPSYGEDAATQQLTEKFSALFETAITVFPVATGTAANALALSVLAPPYGAIYCHEGAHIHLDECGAPELYTGGAKLIPLTGNHGKFTADTLATALEQAGAGVVHHIQPAAVSLTQATEAGTIYHPEEVQAIATLAKSHGLSLHMDGARFANALVALGCSPADITWRAGVDVLCFGATKNGAMAAEAVLFFNPELAQSFAFRRKRGGQLWSKMRFLSAQLNAYLDHDLWLKHAAHANQMAQQLAQGLARLPGVSLAHPVHANEVFVWMPEPLVEHLLDSGFQFYRWQASRAVTEPTLVRLVTAFNTEPETVSAFLAAAQHRLQMAP